MTQQFGDDYIMQNTDLRTAKEAHALEILSCHFFLSEIIPLEKVQ